MKLKPIEIKIQEENNGDIRLELAIRHEDGATRCTDKIREYSVGKKFEAIAEKIVEILYELRNDGSLEE